MKTIQVKGLIVSDNEKWLYEWLERSATAPKDIVLPTNGEDVEVIINSGGGDVYAGSEIYTMLRAYDGHVTVKVVGVAASAASVIAMAGDVIEISPTAQIMIHNVSTRVEGDSQKLLKEAGVLENYNVSIANAYLDKTGKSMEELLELMRETTWFNAQQAVEQGFADKVMFDSQQAPLLVASSDELISENVAEKLITLLSKQAEENRVNETNKDTVIDYDLLAEKIALKIGNLENQQKKIKMEAPKGFGAYLF